MVTRFVRTARDWTARFLAGNGEGGRVARARSAPGATVAATGFVTVLRHRGIGYIARDGAGDRADLFFDRAGVAANGFAGLRAGERVSFDEEPDPGGRDRPRAVNVRPVGETADPPPAPPAGAAG